MRIEFVQTDSRESAEAACPWAADIAEVDGGYQCFESADDARTWASQV